MKKYVLDLTISHTEHISEKHVLLRLTYPKPLPEMRAGQFVEVRIEGEAHAFLRRPISINFLDKERNEMWLLVAAVGNGTRHIAGLKAGDTLNCVLPLGNGFTMPDGQSAKCLLVGGGVGVAPLLFMGSQLAGRGIRPTFLLGAKTQRDVLLLEEFKRYGDVKITTEDGSLGERGFVTNHSVLNGKFDQIFVCGPKPMMQAVTRYARKTDTKCEVSLENMMACGLGACLCCVEKTVRGNVCVCKEGPVMNVNDLLW